MNMGNRGLKTKELWKNPVYKKMMSNAHIGQKVWNEGLKTGLIPKTAFKKGHQHGINWYEVREKLKGENSPNWIDGRSFKPDYPSVQKQKRRTWKLKNGGSYSYKEWEELKNQYGNICLSCKKSEVLLVPDHIVPLSKGGSSDIDNIQPLCSSCNHKKYNKIIDYRLCESLV